MKKMLMCLLITVAALCFADNGLTSLTASQKKMVIQKMQKVDAESYMTYCDETPPYMTIGTGVANSFEVSSRFTADELTGFYGQKITKLHLMLCAPEEVPIWTSVVVKIYKGGTPPQPGTVVYSQDVTASAVLNDWTDHTLTTPITLENNQEYWIGYEIQTTGGPALVADRGPCVQDKGSFIKFNGSWTALSDVMEGADYNWMVKATLLGPDTQPPKVVAVRGTSGVGGFPTSINLTVADLSNVPPTISASYNVGGSDVVFTMNRDAVSRYENKYSYTGTIPAQVSGTQGTVKFQTADVVGNSAWTATTWPLSWNAPAAELNENFDGVALGDIPEGWLIEDINEDGYTWKTVDGPSYYAPSNALAITYNDDMETPKDDWTFTKPFVLTAGKKYAFSFKYKVVSSACPEKLEIKYGSTVTSTGMNSIPLFYNDNITSTVYQTSESVIEPTTTGVNYIGFHCFSDADQYMLMIDEVKLSQLGDDTSAPVITSIKGNEAAMGSPLNICLKLADQTGISSITGHYQLTGESSWTDFPLTPQNKLNFVYTGTIPAQAGVKTGQIKFTLKDNSPAVNSAESALSTIEWYDPAKYLFENFDSDLAWPPAGWSTVETYVEATWYPGFIGGASSFNHIDPDNIHSAVTLYSNAVNVMNEWMISPQVNVQDMINPSLNFYGAYSPSYFPGGSENPNPGYDMIVKVSADNGTTWTDVWKATENTEPNIPFNWHRTEIGHLKQYGNNLKFAWVYQGADGDMMGLDSVYINRNSSTVSITEQLTEKLNINLSQNYPNPFNPSTTISFNNSTAGMVRLSVFNAKGEVVTQLINENRAAGQHSAVFNATNLNSGVYFYRLETPSGMQTRKMMMIK